MDLKRAARLFGVAASVGLIALMVPLPQIDFIERSVAAVEPLEGLDPSTPAEVAEVQQAADEPLGDQRVRAVEEETAEFALVAVVFDSAPTAPAMVRVKRADSTWDDWTELHVDTGEGPDAQTNWGTEPFWVGSSDGYELDLAPQDAEAAEVVLVRESVQRAVTVSEPVAAAATAAPFGINSRAAWGARAPRAVNYGSTIRKAIVHHTVSGNGYSQSQVPGIIRGIQAYHQDGRGWDDIGYNFLVDRFGGIWEGRGGGIDRAVVGAHASGFNTNTVGISILGDYSGSRPSAAAVEGVSRVAGWKLFLGGVEPISSGAFTSGGGPKYPAGTVVNLPNVVGHGDVGSTGCPGRTREVLPQIRQRAQDWANWTKAISGPAGNLETVATSGLSLRVKGWAADLDVSNPSQIRVKIDGLVRTTTANLRRDDVKAANPSYPSNTGFDATFGLPVPGVRLMCVTVVNQGHGKDKSLGCRDVRLSDPSGHSPDGRFTSASGSKRSLSVRGWARDPDAPGKRPLNIYSNGRLIGSTTTATDGSFSFTKRDLDGGKHRVCMSVPNAGPGINSAPDCAYINVAGAQPTGNLDGFKVVGRTAHLSGWAMDEDAGGPIRVNIVYDGRTRWTTVTGRSRPDVAAVLGTGANSGYAVSVPGVPNGRHRICAVAVNVGLGSDQNLGCRDFTVK